MKSSKLLIAALLSISAVSANAANLVNNGGFEATNSAANSGWQIANPMIAISPISVYSSCCAIFGTYNAGNNAAFLGWGDKLGGTLFQDIATTIGQTYDLSFSYGAIAAANPQRLEVDVLNLDTFDTIASNTFSATGTYDLSQILSTYHFTFTATSSNTRISFVDRSQTTFSTDGVLDNVAVSAVPEPETNGMVLAGLGLMGLVVSRRKIK